jgi:hypothetical protein
MLVVFSAVVLFIPQRFYGATATIGVDCSKDLGAISPYVYGHNSSNYYCPATMTNSVVIQALRDVKISMFRWPAGACMQRFDFKYNNYQGRMWNAGISEWATNCPSIEDELQFCHDVGAEPLVGLNVSFSGPNGTSGDDYDDHSNDYASYTGCYLPDTPENRAKYAADMVSYIRTLCASKGWDPPEYYGVGNEYMCDGQTVSEYLACWNAYYDAVKAVDSNAKLLPGIFSPNLIEDFGDKMYAMNLPGYNPFVGDAYLERARYWPAILDGAFGYMTYEFSGNGDVINRGRDEYERCFPGRDELKFVMTEWGDHWGTGSHNTDYEGAMYWAHMLYRCIKNKVLLDCSWFSIQSDWTTVAGLFAPTYLPFACRPRYYSYLQYTANFGDTLLECYDPEEYIPGVSDYFRTYKDDRDNLIVIASRRSDGNIAIMATNLSRLDSYDTQINIANFDMGGVVDVHTMNDSNCYEGGPGPSMSTLTGQSSPISYTFAPFTVTCLVVKGESDVPVITNVASGNITVAGATITWDTDRTSTSQVEYGPTVSYGNSTSEDSNLVTSHSVNLTGLASGTEYHYRVICKDSENKESMSVDYKFTTLGKSGINVKVYPNPLVVSKGGQITFSVSGTTGGEIKIYTLSGKLVKELLVGAGASEVNWDVLNEDGNSITTGLYLYSITDSDGNSKTGKLVISN